MNQEELKQRLIELLEKHEDTINATEDDCVWGIESRNFPKVVDYLIASGVTIRERGEWKEVYQNKQATVYECSKCHHLSFGTSDYCVCGADMQGEAIHDKMVESRKNIKFETGDHAKIARNINGHAFEIGTIVRLEKYDTDYKAFVSDEFWWVIDDELEPIEGTDV